MLSFLSVFFLSFANLKYHILEENVVKLKMFYYILELFLQFILCKPSAVELRMVLSNLALSLRRERREKEILCNAHHAIMLCSFLSTRIRRLVLHEN